MLKHVKKDLQKQVDDLFDLIQTLYEENKITGGACLLLEIETEKMVNYLDDIKDRLKYKPLTQAQSEEHQTKNLAILKARRERLDKTVKPYEEIPENAFKPPQ